MVANLFIDLIFCKNRNSQLVRKNLFSSNFKIDYPVWLERRLSMDKASIVYE